MYNSSYIIRLEYVIVNALDERDLGRVALKALAFTKDVKPGEASFAQKTKFLHATK